MGLTRWARVLHNMSLCNDLEKIKIWTNLLLMMIGDVPLPSYFSRVPANVVEWVYVSQQLFHFMQNAKNPRIRHEILKTIKRLTRVAEFRTVITCHIRLSLLYA
jgi:hypothetical protein